MPRTGKYKIGPVVISRKKVYSGRCRISGCKFYHKFLKDLGRHILHTHHMTLAVHDKLPLSSLENVLQKSNDKPYMKHRKLSICLMLKCSNHFQNLTRHLKTVHGLTRKEYRRLILPPETALPKDNSNTKKEEVVARDHLEEGIVLSSDAGLSDVDDRNPSDPLFTDTE